MNELVNSVIWLDLVKKSELKKVNFDLKLNVWNILYPKLKNHWGKRRKKIQDQVMTVPRHLIELTYLPSLPPFRLYFPLNKLAKDKAFCRKIMWFFGGSYVVLWWFFHGSWVVLWWFLLGSLLVLSWFFGGSLVVLWWFIGGSLMVL